MTNRDTILRWLLPPADDAAAWSVVKACAQANKAPALAEKADG